MRLLIAKLNQLVVAARTLIAGGARRAIRACAIFVTRPAVSVARQGMAIFQWLVDILLQRYYAKFRQTDYRIVKAVRQANEVCRRAERVDESARRHEEFDTDGIEAEPQKEQTESSAENDRTKAVAIAAARLVESVSVLRENGGDVLFDQGNLNGLVRLLLPAP